MGRISGPVDAAVAPVDARNQVFMGTSVTTGTGEAVVGASLARAAVRDRAWSDHE